MHAFSVSEFLELANNALRDFWDSSEFVVEGEVTDFRVSRGQWVNFSVKDEQGLLGCFMVAYRLNIPIQDGMKVRLHGYPRIYAKYGKFSFNVESVELVGEGDLQKALKLLREKLEKEGLFDPARKRELPRFPEKIALIASTESAAYGDFVRVVNERWRGLGIDAYHVLVQGPRAPQSMIRAIAAAQKKSYDALVLTRGGGSLEELMAFNDEALVRAIHGSKIPTLVGIGHERDMSLAEEAADVRASTPTDCARRLIPDKSDVLYEIATREQGITMSLTGVLESRRRLIDEVTLRAENWISRIEEDRAEKIRLIGEAFSRHASRAQESVEALSRLCRSFDPKNVLSRGYAYIEAEERVLSSVDQLRPGKKIGIHLRDGRASATIDES